MANTDRPQNALQTIFSFFLGLMVVAFVGVGVNTFYPSPAQKFDREMRAASQRHEALARKSAPGAMSDVEQARLDSLTAEQNRLQDLQQAEMKDWARVTSIILVLFATTVLVISLMRSEQLRVISNGLLLGGLFTMVYGVGWAVFSGNSVARFWVILFSLAVAIGLGYVKFVAGRRRETPIPGPAGGLAGATAGPGTPTAAAGIAELSELAARVAALEERAAAASAALAGERDHRHPGGS